MTVHIILKFQGALFFKTMQPRNLNAFTYVIGQELLESSIINQDCIFRTVYIFRMLSNFLTFLRNVLGLHVPEGLFSVVQFIERISQPQETVFHQDIQTFRRELKL